MVRKGARIFRNVHEFLYVRPRPIVAGDGTGTVCIRLYLLSVRYLFSVWSCVLLRNMVLDHMVKKFAVFYGNPVLVTTFVTAHPTLCYESLESSAEPQTLFY